MWQCCGKKCICGKVVVRNASVACCGKKCVCGNVMVRNASVACCDKKCPNDDGRIEQLAFG